MNDQNTGWRKRQIALDKKAENARELGLDYKPDKTIMEMAREAGAIEMRDNDSMGWGCEFELHQLEAFAKLVREDELARLEHNHTVLMNALWKACGDDEQMVNDTIESQGELK